MVHFRSWPIPSPNSQPIEIALGNYGNLWFTEQNASRVARITPRGSITEFSLPTFGFPNDITSGPDGNVWFTERFSQRIGKVTPSGQFTFYTTALHTLESIVTGPDGNLWFTSFGDHRLARITPQGVITEMPIAPGNPGPTGLASGPLAAPRTLWFLGYGNNRVYAMTLP
ncbi:MAG TPA: hypothetical protein VMS76_20365 [Planctomycetota bacterium]|nr:hypothetical protein [Planctomycetota bacterium]